MQGQISSDNESESCTARRVSALTTPMWQHTKVVVVPAKRDRGTETATAGWNNQCCCAGGPQTTGGAGEKGLLWKIRQSGAMLLLLLLCYLAD